MRHVNYFTVLLLASGIVCGTTPRVLAEAIYELTFSSAWSAETHPDAYPSFAHFSPLVGGTHNAVASYWEPGGIASAAIEQVAETGGTTQLRNLINADITAGNASALVTSGGIAAPGSRTLTFTVSPDYPLFTIVTMVAPSPDWFVGTHGLDFRENGQWIQSLSLDLLTYDAGTDAGPNFNSSNADVTPHEPIAVLGDPITGLPPLGNFTFTLVSADALCDTNADGSCSIEDLNQLLNLGPIAEGVSVTYGVNDAYDLNDDQVIDLSDRDAWLAGAAIENGLNSPYFPADGNLDGTVDGNDFLIWSGHRFTSNLNASQGDFNGDGFVDGQDFLVWNDAKFLSSDVNVVPEPSFSVVLMGLTLLFGLRFRLLNR